MDNPQQGDIALIIEGFEDVRGRTPSRMEAYHAGLEMGFFEDSPGNWGLFKRLWCNRD